MWASYLDCGTEELKPTVPIMTNYLMITFVLLVSLCTRKSDTVTVSPVTEILVVETNTGNVTSSGEQSNVTDGIVVSDKITKTHVTESPETEVLDSSETTVLRRFSITIPSEHATASPETEVKEVNNSLRIVTDRRIVTDVTTDRNVVVEDGNSTTSPGNVTDTDTTSPLTSAKPNPYAIINQGLVSKKQYETCSLVINIILKPIVCIGGVVMNVIGVCVLLQKRFRSSTYIYLCILAFSDIGVLLCGIVRVIPKFVKFYDDVLANSIDVHIFPYENIFLSATFTRISEYIICALAIERFVAVLKPLKVRELFLCRHALAVCIGVSVFCVLFHVHFLFIYYPKPYFNPSVNATMYALGRRPWYRASGIKPVYDMLYEILFMYAPVLILITCNVGILLCIKLRNRQRKIIVANDNNRMSKEQRKITLTLLIISFFFLVVLTPLTVLTIVQKFNKDIKAFGREHYLLYLIIDVLTLGWNMNSANDFIVYIYTSRQFKHALVELICCKKSRKNELSAPKCVEDKGSSTNTNDAPCSVKNAFSTETLITDTSVASHM